MLFGLSDADFETICALLKKFPHIEEAIIFGSRAKGTHRSGSDVDIVLKGKELEKVIIQVSTFLNQESLLPYTFDILNYNEINNNDLLDHIARVGKSIYTRES